MTSPTKTFARFLAGLVTALVMCPAAFLSAQPVISEGGARVVAVENLVRLQRRGSTAYVTVGTNDVLVAGDALSTGPDSSATLLVGDKALYRVDELTDLLLSPGGGPGTRFEVEVREGGFYLLNRDTEADQRFRTPVASGAILGTEVAVRVGPDGQTTVALLEGRVDLGNDLGTVQLAAGEQGEVRPGQPPTKTALLDVVAPVQWAIYYPGVLDPEELDFSDASKAALLPSLEAYRAGDLLGALAAYPTGRTASDDAEKTYRAALSLAVGQAAKAGELLTGIASPVADALREVIAAAQGRPADPAPLPLSATAHLARSYSAQAVNDLAAALTSARKAAEIAPGFGFAHSRVAELEFSFGRTAAARGHLERSLQLAPRNAQAWSLRGFLAAADGDLTAALAHFNHALELDPQLAPARLGRGLCQIRQGRLADGRTDLQAAAALEPTRSVYRSYLGKAWNEERDNAHAESELARARELDPDDPTPWLYSALVRQQQNQINQAIQDLERSQAVNDNRGVYRSRQLLDQDRAVRGANLASVYRDAGMTVPSVRAASRAVADDYGNASAHLFLASSYDTLRDPRLFNLRYETPWFSELLLANLLAPVGVGTLSQNVSQQEYSRLFERNRLGVSSVTEYYSDGTWTQRGSQFGTFGDFGYALDVDYRSEPGFAQNTDLERLSLYAKAKWQVTPGDSLFLQLNYNRYESGDTRQLYDPTWAGTTFRSEEEQAPNLFAGWHHQWAPGQHTVLLLSRLDDTLEYADANGSIPVIRRPNPATPPNLITDRPFDVAFDSDLVAYGAELQHIADLELGQAGRHTVVVGVRYQAGDVDTTAGQTYQATTFPSGFVLPPVSQTVESDLDRLSLYVYDTWEIIRGLRLTAGLSYEHLDFPANIDLPPLDAGQRDEDMVSPKLGLEWSPTDDTHLRAAWTRSLGGSYYDASVRLEPVQVAGFTQAFRSLIPESVAGLVPGSEFETFGVGLDHRFPTRTYLTVTAEQLTSEADQGFGAFLWTVQGGGLVAPPVTMTRRLDYEEQALTVTANQLLGDRWAVGASYRLTESELDERYPADLTGIVNDPNRSLEATLHQVAAFLRFNHECGFFSEFTAIWNQQSNRGYTPALPGDDFWLFNVYAGYRFLQRRAEVRLGVLNLGDQDYRLNPLNLHDEYLRERTFYASLRLNF